MLSLSLSFAALSALVSPRSPRAFICFSLHGFTPFSFSLKLHVPLATLSSVAGSSSSTLPLPHLYLLSLRRCCIALHSSRSPFHLSRFHLFSSSSHRGLSISLLPSLIVPSRLPRLSFDVRLCLSLSHPPDRRPRYDRAVTSLSWGAILPSDNRGPPLSSLYTAASPPGFSDPLAGSLARIYRSGAVLASHAPLATSEFAGTQINEITQGFSTLSTLTLSVPRAYLPFAGSPLPLSTWMSLRHERQRTNENCGEHPASIFGRVEFRREITEK